MLNKIIKYDPTLQGYIYNHLWAAGYDFYIIRKGPAAGVLSGFYTAVKIETETGHIEYCSAFKSYKNAERRYIKNIESATHKSYIDVLMG